MSSNLGLYIENNMIKYAKISKEKNKIKIDSFGIKCYSDLKSAIDQVISETYSYKIPISINLTEETYQYFTMFSLLNKKDLEKAIKLEFETYCDEKGYNTNSIETRYVATPLKDDDEKLRIINISDNKMELNKVKSRLDGYKLTTIAPVSMTIPNLIESQPNENILIVNMEEKTTVTTIYNNNIYSVDSIDEGSRIILEKINLKENSYSKAYEICQNTTIYTADTQDFNESPSEYLEDIMPTLYTIIGKVQKIINESIEPIKKVYITGTLSCINNVDLYFQEYLGKVKCEILRPYFVQNLTKEVNIKEYIEVNSAISLALQGLAEGVQGINFKKNIWTDSLNITIGGKNENKKEGNKNKISFKFDDFSDRLSKNEMHLVRSCIALLIFFVIYSGFSVLLTKQIKNKQDDVDKVTQQINSQIASVDSDVKMLDSKKTQYSTLIKDLEEVNERISDINASRNLIPNLLNQIMNTIDSTVQITSIENTTEKHIVIKAQSPKYPGLGYFKTKLKTNGILLNVVSGSSMKVDGVITVTIEGDLP